VTVDIQIVCDRCGRRHTVEEVKESRFCVSCGKFLRLKNRVKTASNASIDTSDPFALFPYQPYPQQVEFIKDATRVLRGGGVLLAEACNGFGKTSCSLASVLSIERKVVYATRTHEQVRQVMSELRRINDKSGLQFTAVSLASRQHLCVNEKCRRLSSLEGRETCRLLRRTGQCSLSIEIELESQYLPKVMDVRELRSYGEAHRMCPYYLARRMVDHRTVTVAPYQYIFNDAIRELIKLNLAGKVLIFDEAHNADQIGIDVLSDTLSGTSLERARRELEQLEESTDLIDILENYLEEETADEVRVKWGRELLSDLHRLIGEDLSSSIDHSYGHVEAIRELKLNQGELPISYLNGVLTFLAFVEESLHDCYVAVYKHSYYGVPLIEYRCLDPSLAIKPVIELSSGTLIMSGTLSPVELFSKILGLNETDNHVYSSIADEDSVKTLVDNTVTSRYSKRGQAMMVRYGKRIASLSEKVPNGALVFFPQRRMMMECVSNWRRNRIVTERDGDVFMGSKKVFVEGANARENAKIVEEYKRTTTDSSGALLLGVFRGRNAEGSNFPDEQARAVFLVGVPFADYRDPVVKAQIEYFNRKSKTLGEKWYLMDAFRAANQAMGRGIRHRDDWCNFILMDNRYGNNLKLISSWALQKGVQRLPRDLS